jgi:hypothetical protein
VALDPDAAADLDRRVDRLLREAGAYGRFPTPVDDIVQAAQLAEADDYVLDESMISKAPAYLHTLLRSGIKKIRGLVDRRARVIHLNPGIENEGKRRFVKLHETVHHVVPHQRDLLYADDHETLSPATTRLFEQEANQGAAELLFQRASFTADAADLEISTAAVRALAGQYGSSVHAAFRRYTETHPGAVAGIVLATTPYQHNPAVWQRHEAMATAAWTRRFGPPTWPKTMNEFAYPFLSALLVPELTDAVMTDRRGNAVEVNVDIFQTPYQSFVLLSLPPSRRTLIRPRAVRVTTP